jgi:hypothetical protein
MGTDNYTVYNGTAFSAVCDFIVGELHLTFSFLVAYSPNGVPFVTEELHVVYQVCWK